jgi:hypothetical protein
MGMLLLPAHSFTTLLLGATHTQVEYPEIEEGTKPRHRFMSAYEQKVETADKSYQYLLFAAEPYEVVAFKVPNAEVVKDEERFFSHWWGQGGTDQYLRSCLGAASCTRLGDALSAYEPCATSCQLHRMPFPAGGPRGMGASRPTSVRTGVS